MPRPANADIRCSIVSTLPPSRDRPVHSIVSVTSSAFGGNVDDRIQVDAPEHDAGIDGGRTQREIDLLAAVQPDAGGADHVLEGALLEHAGSSLERGRDSDASDMHGSMQSRSTADRQGPRRLHTAV